VFQVFFRPTESYVPRTVSSRAVAIASGQFFASVKEGKKISDIVGLDVANRYIAIYCVWSDGGHLRVVKRGRVKERDDACSVYIDIRLLPFN